MIATIADTITPYYPNGSIPKMHQLADVYEHARGQLVDLAAELNAKLQSLTGNNDSDDLHALQEFWQRVTGTREGTLLSALPQTCQALARGCGDYASAIEHTREKIHDILQNAALELAGAGILIAVGSLLTDGLAAPSLTEGAGGAVTARITSQLAVVAGQLVTTIGTATALATAAEATGALTMAINNTPEPNVGQTGSGLGGRAGGTDSTAPELKINRKQIEKKYDRHARDFGVDKPRSKESFDEFEAAVRDFVQRPDLDRMPGTYRGQSVYFNVDKNTGLFVMQKPNGEFLSGWRLNPDQLTNVLTRAKL